MIVRLHAANPGPFTGAGNWTYFLPGENPVLIDAGVGEAAHLDAVAQSRSDGPTHVIVTHAHSDHIAGAGAIAARWPATRFSKYLWPDRDARHGVSWSALNDGAIVAAGDSKLEVIHTPGHSPDHIALWDGETRTLFSGDLVTAATTVVIPATSGGSLTAYLESLRRVLTLAPAKLLPAHGPEIDDPIPLLQRYIQHRHEREVQVRSALDDGLQTIDAIVERIYTGLAPALLPMARESVLAHLLKLQDEGLAEGAGDRWRPL